MIKISYLKAKVMILAKINIAPHEININIVIPMNNIEKLLVINDNLDIGIVNIVLSVFLLYFLVNIYDPD